MRKLIVIFTTVVLSVVCLSVSAFAYTGDPDCTHCGYMDYFLNDDGTYNHSQCCLCWVDIVDDNLLDLSASEMLSYLRDELSADRLGYLYLNEWCYDFDTCYHLDNSGSNGQYLSLFVDVFFNDHGFYCSSCNVVMLDRFCQPTPDEYPHEGSIYECSVCDKRAGSLGNIIVSDNSLRALCFCPWSFVDNPNVRVLEKDGKHDIFCLDCGGIYSGLIGLEFPDFVECTGDGCSGCSFAEQITGFPVYHLPPTSKTLTDYVTDTGSILSSGLDMASTTAHTVAENPVLLLLYAIPFTAIAVIVYRKVKR